MKLSRFRVKNYKSIIDSGWVRVGDITCLVGKNESGKTSLLRALNALNPLRDLDANFSVTDDYPRSRVGDYQRESEAEDHRPDVAIEAIFTLEASETAGITEQFGPHALREAECTLTKNYANERYFYLNFDEAEAIARADLPPNEAAANVGYLKQMLVHHKDLRDPKKTASITSHD